MSGGAERKKKENKKRAELERKVEREKARDDWRRARRSAFSLEGGSEESSCPRFPFFKEAWVVEGEAPWLLALWLNLG